MRRLSVLLTCLLTVVGLVAVAGPADAAPIAKAAAKANAATPAVVTNSAGGYHPIRLVRVFSTSSTGVLAPAVTRKVQVAGANNLPTNIVAVEVNVTVRVPAKSGSLAVFPGTSAFNGYGTVSFTAGQTQQRMITANLGTDGSLALRNNVAGANLEVLLDVVGYYVGGTATQPGAYHPIPIQRVLDPSKAGKIDAYGFLAVPIGGQGALPSDPNLIGAVAVDITLQASKNFGTVSAYTGDSPTNAASPVSTVPYATAQKMVILGLNAGTHDFELANYGSLPASVIVDVVGYFSNGSADSIGGLTTIANDRLTSSSVTAGGTLAIQALPVNGISDAQGLPSYGVWAVKLDVEVNNGSRAGSVSVFSGDESYTGVATSSFPAGGLNASEIVSRVSSGGQILIRNNATVTETILVKVTGYYTYRGNPISTATATTPFPQHDQFSSLSCATVTFCVSGEQSGLVAFYNGRSWTTPAQISGQTSLTALACPAADECFAVGNQITEFDGRSWSVVLPNAPVSGSPRVSCVSTTFCVATFGQRYATWDGTSWTLASDSAVGSSGSVASLSCTSPTFCLGIDGYTHYVVFDGTSWSAAAAVAGTSADFVQSASCVSAQFCQLVTISGKTSTFDGTSWSPDVPAPGAQSYFMKVDCLSTTYCVAVDHDSRSRTFDGTAWSTSAAMTSTAGSVPLGLSCVAVGSCVSVLSANTGNDSSGTYYVGYSVSFDGTAWSSPSGLAAGPGRITGLACPTTTFCAGVTGGGAVSTYDGTAWSAPTTIDVKGGLSDVSCASSSLCLAIGSNGVSTYQAGTWSAPSPLAVGSVPTAVSCSSSGLCAVGDQTGRAWTYQNGAWSQGYGVIPGGPVNLISCSSDNVCMAIHGAGYVSQYNSGGWKTLPQTRVSNGTSLSCVSANYCLVVAPNGAQFLDAEWNGTTWVNLSRGYSAVACTAVHLCWQVDSLGNLTQWDDHYTTAALPVGGAFGTVRLTCPTTTTCFYSDANQTVYKLS